jgi:hypothetical protein
MLAGKSVAIISAGVFKLLAEVLFYDSNYFPNLLRQRRHLKINLAIKFLPPAN